MEKVLKFVKVLKVRVAARTTMLPPPRGWYCMVAPWDQSCPHHERRLDGLQKLLRGRPCVPALEAMHMARHKVLNQLRLLVK